MKKMITVLSFLVAASAFAATSQLVTATLNVVDPVQDIVLSVTTTALTIGEVPIIAGTSKDSNEIDVQVSGTQAKAATVTMPEKVALTGPGGSYDANIVIGNVTGGAVTTAANEHKITTTGALGNGTASVTPMIAKTKAKLDIVGTEKPGIYTGNMTISAQYN